MISSDKCILRAFVNPTLTAPMCELVHAAIIKTRNLLKLKDLGHKRTKKAFKNKILKQKNKIQGEKKFKWKKKMPPTGVEPVRTSEVSD